MEQKRFLIIGAHPDDCDVHCGGATVKLVRAGHAVKYVSVSNGDCGHFNMTNEALAARRYAETQEACKVAGLEEYQVLDHHDCHIFNSLELREEILRIIRRFEPDVVISHRPCDYHADHRNTAQAVMDSAYLVNVPLYCKDTPIPRKNPIFAYCHDPFQDPRPIRPDAVVELDSVMDDVLTIMDCHKSQYYEWLPWDSGYDKNCNVAELPLPERLKWLREFEERRYINQANAARERLIQVYGEEKGRKIRCAEMYEISSYGAVVPPDEFQALFDAR